MKGDSYPLAHRKLNMDIKIMLQLSNKDLGNYYFNRAGELVKVVDCLKDFNTVVLLRIKPFNTFIGQEQYIVYLNGRYSLGRESYWDLIRKATEIDKLLYG